MARLYLAIALVAICFKASLQYEPCANVTGPGDPSHMYPDFNQALNEDYTLMVEMVDIINKETYYIRELRHRSKFQNTDDTMNIGVLSMLKNGTEDIYYYFPDEDNKFIKLSNNECTDVTSETGPLNYWGWWDTDPARGQSLFGPGAFLRWSYSFEVETDDPEGPEPIGGILCNRWRACQGGGNVNLHYIFSEEQWSMPDMDLFTDAHGGFPVQMEFKLMDGSEHIIYNIESFVPFITHHHYLDMPEGIECELLINLYPNIDKPTIVDHFQTREELVVNSLIDGVNEGEQVLDYFDIYYSKELSLVRFDSFPVDKDYNFKDNLKVVHDFNTGVQYVVDKVKGNCSWSFIPINNIDNTGLNHIGSGGSLLGPNEMFHLDDKYGVAGQGEARHQIGYWWTSTRHDIPDTEHPGQFLKKAVMDYLFVTSEEKGEDGKNKFLHTPLRNDFFYYDPDHLDKVIYRQTLNFYGFSEVKLYTEDEFQVSECYSYSDFEWSYLYIIFKANHWQISAAERVPEVVKHQVYKHLLQMSSISPVRISALDITDGISAPGQNITVTDSMIVSVRLLNKAPDIFKFGKVIDTNPQHPGKNEKRIEHVTSVHHCATLCAEDTEMDCLSFHHCDGDLCFLSKVDGQDGEQLTEPKSCELWQQSLVNRTFADTPSYLVDDDIMKHIDEFVLDIPFDVNKTTTIHASEAIHLLSPDPYNFIRMEFSFMRRDTTFTSPNTTVKSVSDMTECETLCMTSRAFRCESLAHDRANGLCLLSSLHYEEMNPSHDLAPQTEVYIMSRSYIFDYIPVFGGVALNTSGSDVVNNVMSFESCARMCSISSKVCNSFEYCPESLMCSMHPDHFLDVSGGDNIAHNTKCVHFSKQSIKDFKTYSNQGMPNSQHKLVAIDSDETFCAHECTSGLESSTCESFDLCSECTAGDTDVCSEDMLGKKNLCYISTKHVGEEGVALKTAKHCIHYSREYFGDEDYDTWKNKGSGSSGGSDDSSGYTSGDMTGLAFGMIFLGIILAIGFLALLVKFKPSTVPQEFSISFKNTVNTSEI